MATFDAFTLGAVVAQRTARAALTIGPLAVAVRDPVMIAMGAGSLAELTGRTVNVALGSSSPVVVEQWHGRRQERTALALAESAAAVRALLAGDKADVRGEVISTRGFRLRTRAPGTPLTIAAFGPGAVKVAAREADRMVINLVTPKSAARLVQMLYDECRAAAIPLLFGGALVSAYPAAAQADHIERGRAVQPGGPIQRASLAGRPGDTAHQHRAVAGLRRRPDHRRHQQQLGWLRCDRCQRHLHQRLVQLDRADRPLHRQ